MVRSGKRGEICAKQEPRCAAPCYKAGLAMAGRRRLSRLAWGAARQKPTKGGQAGHQTNNQNKISNKTALTRKPDKAPDK
jgi:hypothetical protein